MRLLKLLLEGRCVQVKILFCNIAWMLYYKGLIPGEVESSSGGEYVRKTGDAHGATPIRKLPRGGARK